jgi:hypothetical protein
MMTIKPNNMKNFKVTDKRVDSVFVWKIVTPFAETLFMDTPFIFDYYELFDDGSESLLINLQQIKDAIAKGNEIGIEVGWVPTN